MISFLIVNYNTEADILKLLGDLKAQTWKQSIEVVLVDNSPKKENEKRFAVSGLDLIYVPMFENLGFGKACNLAAQKCHGDTLVLLNPDLRLSLKKSLEAFIEQNLAGEVGILAPRLIYPNGKPQPSRGSNSNVLTYIFQFLRIGDLIRHYELQATLLDLFSQPPFSSIKFIKNYLKNYEAPTVLRPETVDWVSGAFMIIKREIFDQCEGFDPNFFMYCEDEDLCRRVRDVGFEILWHPDYTATHEVSKSHANHKSKDWSFAQRQRFQSNLYFLKKWNSKFHALLLWCFYLLVMSISALWHLARGNSKTAENRIKTLSELRVF